MIIEKDGEDSVLVYPDEINPEKERMSIEEAYNHPNVREEDILELFADENKTMLLDDDEIHIFDGETGLTIVFSYENYKYEKRKYKDGTGPIKNGLRLTSKTGTVQTKDGTKLFTTKQYKNLAENAIEKREQAEF